MCAWLINRSIGVGNSAHHRSDHMLTANTTNTVPPPTELGEKNIRPVLIDVAKPESVQACVKEVRACVHSVVPPINQHPSYT